MLFLAILIALMGMFGGVINALINDTGFFLPKRLKVGEQDIIKPGFLGNMLIGAASSFVSWALYGPLGSVVIAGAQDPAVINGGRLVGVTLSSLGGAVLIGVAGSRWFSSEIDKMVLRGATVLAARSQASNPGELEMINSLADSMSFANSSTQILRLADKLPKARVVIGSNS